jgi:hypothetical protein
MRNQTNLLKGQSILVFVAVLVGAATVAPGQRGRIPDPSFYYVDAVHGSDNNNGLMPGTALASVQKAIDTAVDGDVILVYPGLYRGEVDFKGKALVVQGVISGAAGIPVLHNPGDFAVSFYSGEGADSILSNFVIKGSLMAVFIAGSSPTINHVTVVDNTYGIEAYVDSEPDISNSIFWRNSGSDLFGCRVRFSRTSEPGQGQGNITDEPLMVDPDSGDYRLRSARGRYWSEHDGWSLDSISSQCIDRGDPKDDPSDEPMPNGNRVNMGAYGGTAQASLSPGVLPGQASNPSPADGAVDVEINATLSWNPGRNAVLHEVYFGTLDPPPLLSSQAVTQFNPGRMDSETVYYWRIDEIDAEGNKTTGDLWQFTTGSGAPVKGRACFVPRTGVWVDGSVVSISKVAIGKTISCANSISVKKSSLPLPYSNKVEEVQEHEGVFQCYDVMLESGNLITVAERHYFLTESNKWLAVQNLRTGMRLQTATGSIAIADVTKRSTPYIGKVYNLKIEGSDRYLVGKDAIVVRDY